MPGVLKFKNADCKHGFFAVWVVLVWLYGVFVISESYLQSWEVQHLIFTF